MLICILLLGPSQAFSCAKLTLTTHGEDKYERNWRWRMKDRVTRPFRNGLFPGQLRNVNWMTVCSFLASVFWKGRFQRGINIKHRKYKPINRCTSLRRSTSLFTFDKAKYKQLALMVFSFLDGTYLVHEYICLFSNTDLC